MDNWTVEIKTGSRIRSNESHYNDHVTSWCPQLTTSALESLNLETTSCLLLRTGRHSNKIYLKNIKPIITSKTYTACNFTSFATKDVKFLRICLSVENSPQAHDISTNSIELRHNSSKKWIRKKTNSLPERLLISQ